MVTYDEPTFGLYEPDTSGSTSQHATIDQRAKNIDYLRQLMSSDWAAVLEDKAELVRDIGQQIMGKPFLPHGDKVLRAFTKPFIGVRVLIVGQDPYPTPGHPIGLSFAVDRDVRPLPASLRNIYAELHSDLGIDPAPHGDLSAWSNQGVMLLNRCLTVSPGQPASHRGLGWETLTEAAILALGKRHLNHSTPLVAVLWGAQAQELEPALARFEVPIVKSSHPSPLSAHRGFLGSRPFSKVNEILVAQGSKPINWRVEQ